MMLMIRMKAHHHILLESDFKNLADQPPVVAGDKLVLIDKNTFERSIFTMPNDTVTVTSMGVRFFLRPGVTKLVEGNINAVTTNPNTRLQEMESIMILMVLLMKTIRFITDNS